MRPEFIAADDKHRAPQKAFNPRVFGRIVGLVRPFWKLLALGLLFTLFHAALHTASIAGVFPIFKILLEDEGLTGWAHRTVVAQRTGLSFAPLADPKTTRLRLTKLSAASPLRAQGLREDALILVPEGQLARAWLGEVARAPAGSTFTVRIVSIELEQSVGPKSATIPVGERSFESGMLLRIASLAPEGRSPLKLLTYILACLVVIVILANLFRYLSEVLVSDAVLRAMMSLRALMYERTMQLPMAFFAAEETSALVTRFVQDIQEIQQGLFTLFSSFVREPMRALFIVVAAFYFDWRITLVMIAVAPVAVMLFWQVGRRVKKANTRLLQQYGRMIGTLTTSLQNIRVVKAYTAEEEEQKRLRIVDWQMFRHQLRLAKLRAFTSPMMETIAVVAAGMLTVWLASRVIGGQIEMSHFLTLGVFLSMLFDPLRRLSDVYVRLQRSTAGGERIFEVADAPIERDTQDGSETLGPLERSIDYRGVTFTYPKAERPALIDIDLTISRGETAAIVGPNGCGKTTLVSMLPRFFEPTVGAILYDGVDLKSTDLKSLREQISLVSQEAVVFAGTPVENIAYGRSEPDMDRVLNAARRAHADEFINELPGGYQAVLGERGTTLSGGQRQRLVIARAIYRNAPILIFDEATSQIDTESERKIHDALRAFAEDRTTLIIAHRLSTIQFADRIIVMDAGRILDIGTHAELITRCSLYRTLCETQFVTEPV